MRTLAPNAVICGFRLNERARLEEIGSEVFLFTHEVLGCRALAIKNGDPNKTFCIAFATAPTDSTGVAHILEHSVLMGSRKYPVRDVFGEIHKGGLLTFLNAMTGADCTWYPFATRNLREYFNIMDVYCDVTLHPLLASTTFAQEGWRLHLEAEDAAPQLSGVVFNEMKGAFSDPLRTLVHDVYKGLMPGSTYAHESGGDPRRIPDLSFEDFCRFHATHYHPSNATLFFYGDAPLEEELAFVQERFLAAYEAPGEPARPLAGEVPREPGLARDRYPVAEDGEIHEKTFAAAACVAALAHEREAILGCEILANILFNSDASPLKNAVVGAGLGRDFGGLCLTGAGPRALMLAYLVGSEADRAERFFALYEQTLRDIADGGLDPELVLSELNTFEFKVREEMNKPQRGLTLIMRAQEAMKHGISPFEALQVDELLAGARRRAGQGWFEELIKTRLLDNPASVRVVLEPDPEGMEKNRREEAERVTRMTASLDAEARRALVAETQKLAALQSAPPTTAELAHLPRLSLAELDARPPIHQARAAELAGRPFLASELDAAGVVYFDLGFDCRGLDYEELLYLDLFGIIATELGTAKKDYRQWAKELNLHTGGLEHSFHAYSRLDAPGETRPVLWLHGKALSGYLPQAAGLVGELLAETDFSDHRRIEEIVLREFAWAEQNAQSEGYDLAARRAFAHLGLPGQYGDAVLGMSAYRRLQALAGDYRKMEGDFLAALARIRAKLFRRPGLILNVTAEGRDIERFADLAASPANALEPTAVEAITPAFPEFPAGEAFTASAEIVYNAQVCRLFAEPGGYSGDFEVLKTWLSRDYLWNTVRQKGGAYGCFVRFNPVSGAFGLISYRDPQVAGAYAAFADIPQAVAKLDLSDAALEQLVIGAYGGVNPHQGPAARGAQARDRHLSGITPDFVQTRLDALLSANAAGLRRYADRFAPLAAAPIRVSVGNGEKIRRAAGLFERIEAL